MASSICHVVGVTKLVRLERIVMHLGQLNEARCAPDTTPGVSRGYDKKAGDSRWLRACPAEAESTAAFCGPDLPERRTPETSTCSGLLRGACCSGAARNLPRKQSRRKRDGEKR
jgi:hypothetical protein